MSHPQPAQQGTLNPIQFPTMKAINLRQKVLNTILEVRRLRMIVIIPANAQKPGTPLVCGYLFIAPFLADWTENKIHWGLATQAHKNQPETYIQIDLSAYPEGSVEASQQEFSFPVYVLRSDSYGVRWEFYRHGTRSSAKPQGMLAELERLCLI